MTNIDIFNEYLSNFDLKNPDILGKYNHSFRVMQFSKDLAKYLNLPKEDIKLASDIGLLHDIGRFEQLKQYSSYDDRNSIDHAEYGADLLFKKGMIEKFDIKNEDYKVVEIAIRNHNKYSVQDGLSDRELLFCKIIRDADKLDILNRICVIKDIDLDKYSLTDISKEIKESFFNKELSSYANVKNDSDFIVLFIGYIYDLNYKYSFEYIKDKNFMKLFKDEVNNSIFDEYFKFAIKYIEERID